MNHSHATPATRRFCAAAAVPLAALALSACTPTPADDPGYVAEMPSVEAVKSRITGGDALETKVFQACAGNMLEIAVARLAGERAAGNRLTPEEKRLQTQYSNLYWNTLRAIPNSPRKNALVQKCPGMKDELAEKLLPPAYLSRYRVSTAIFDRNGWGAYGAAQDQNKTMLILFGVVAAIALLAGWIKWTLVSRRRRYRRMVEAMNRQVLEQFGKTREERQARIDQLFDQRNGSVSYHLEETFSNRRIKGDFSRSLAAMPPRDREVLRASLHLLNLGMSIGPINSYKTVAGIIFGDGKATVYGLTTKDVPGETAVQMIQAVLEENSESAVNLGIHDLLTVVGRDPDHPLLKRLSARIIGDGGDLDPPDALSAAALGALSGKALIVGGEGGAPDRLWTFEGEGALITIAPPGSGKTQCHVIPNLLTWTGPAFVLDIKGEIFDRTSGWRQANVGPVYRFAPLDPDSGHRYNPLLAVSDNSDLVWEDARFLAGMLIVPGPKGEEGFWDNSARALMTAAIAQVVRSRPKADRTMGAVLDILNSIDWDAFVASLAATSDNPAMRRAGQSLSEIEDKMRDSVLRSALSHLGAFEGPRIGRATAASDWQATDLLSGANPTVYICINPNEIEAYASLLRVVLAQHIRLLIRKLQDRGQATTNMLFMLDELPRLRSMPPVEEALEIGRQYGIKLWMFAQSVGQLENAYANAKGMLASCALRLFMNPSLADGTAQKLSDDMGFRDSILDGSRVKRVEPDALAGPSFRNKIVVMGMSVEAGSVDKHFTYEDAELKRRSDLPAAIITRNSSGGNV